MATLAALLLLTACTGADETDGAAAQEEATAVAAVEIQPRDLSRELAVSATVEPRRTIRVASRATGTLDAVGPEIGDRVAADDVLARVNRDEQRAELQRARSRVEDAELAYERSRELRERESISAAEYERTRIDLAIARSEQLLHATRVEYGRVRAPRDGVVSARAVEPGEAVASEDTLLELVSMDHLVIRPGISERDVGDLERGQTVPIRIDALPDDVIEGRVARIFPTAERDSRQVTVEIDLPPDAADNGIRPGYLARIRMPVDHRPDALAVPAESIGEDEEGEPYVYVIDDEELVRRTVERGVARGGWTEIRAGLEVGEVVLASNPLDRVAGERVRIVGWRG